MTSPYKIKWAGMSSLDFDVWTELSFDEDSGQTSTFLNRENITTEHYDGKRTIHRSKYQEVLSPTITFIKQDYENFDFDENRKILSWLTSRENPGFLEIFHDDSEVVSYRLFGNWIEIEQYKLGNGRVVGYVATFESTHPYAWSRKFTYPEVHVDIAEISNNNEENDYLTVSGKQSIKITCNSDEYNKLLFPKVTIIFDDGIIYFPVESNPQDAPDKMIPNVIYKWHEEYRKATSYQEDFVYYSDTKGTLADPQPSSATEIGNRTYYIKVSQDHLYININQGDQSDQGKVEILNTYASETPPSNLLAEGYYYFSTDQTVRKIVKDDKNNLLWKIVSHVGAAVKIDNDYTLNGEPVKKEVIIAGGALGETVILNGANKIISSTNNNQLNTIGDDFNWEWPSFVAGDNTLAVTGNCKIKFEWLEPRKVGSL